ncbi:hypothetical protein KJ365_11945 [Glaciecola sp. XM2]|jgi:hypothetical protein|uniref:hypothetical protein n=1 Tax=Glaciecola sp. XM2 TaxID=1914931 RepID=UPI001BDF3BF2|nr:hypothetical protein [Glaciecola sp. XM2]MBT1451594.1 hypothetical protein [Glaciecola sp. XM2]
MFRRILSKSSVIAAVLVLSGCAVPSASDIFSPQSNKDYSNVYLRGVFNWWEATEPFKFTPVDQHTFAVEIELIADGQPYDFKVADENWLPEYNCGLPDASSSIEENDEVELYCYSDSLNLQFVPSETATYRFELDTRNPQYPSLLVFKVS